MKSLLFIILLSAIAATASAQLPNVVSYQGRLQTGDEPANDPNAALVFRVYLDAELGEPIWIEEHAGVAVQDGVFSVLLGSLNPIPFRELPFGEPLWLGVSVADAEEMSPRTPIVAVPYSLQAGSIRGLRVLWTDDANAPSMIGGHPVNQVSETAQGGTISGGGYSDGATQVYPNRVEADYGTVGGGVSNSAVGPYSTVGGGTNNRTGDWLGTVAGGAGNRATGYAAVIGGGGDNRAVGVHATVPGGFRNRAAGDFSVAAGYNAKANHEGSFVWNDRSRTATDQSDSLFSTAPNQFLVRAAGGMIVEAEGHHGVQVTSAGAAGVRVDGAATNGIYVGDAGQNGVFVARAGNPTDTAGSPSHDGFEVQGAQGEGLYVGRADGNGVQIASAGGHGVWVESAAVDGLVVKAGNPSRTSTWYTSDGLEIQGAEGQGIYIGRADENGVDVASAGASGFVAISTGLDGLHVRSAGDATTSVQSPLNNGVEVAGAEGHGLYVGHADQDGVHVDGVNGWAGNFQGDVRIADDGATEESEASVYVVGNSSMTHPHLSLQETGPSDFARLRLQNSDAGADYWDVAAGGTNTDRLNLFTRDHNVITFWPHHIDYVNLITTSVGAVLTQGGVWQNNSSRASKTDFRDLEPLEVLQKVATLPVTEWSYKAEPESVRHIGPMAEDFREAFGLGTDDRTIGTADADGVSLAAIQGLYKLALDQQLRIRALESQVASLSSMIGDR